MLVHCQLIEIPLGIPQACEHCLVQVVPGTPALLAHYRQVYRHVQLVFGWHGVVATPALLAHYRLLHRYVQLDLGWHGVVACLPVAY